jgi:hypothetical protein
MPEGLLPIWIPGYTKLFGPLTPDVSQALLQISSSIPVFNHYPNDPIGNIF